MINYELAKEIGATHYHDRTGEMYKVDLGSLLVFRRDCWFHSGLPLGEVVSKIKPIPTKRTRTEYEKVTESASHVIDEFENGGEFYYMAPSLTKPALANRGGVFNKLRDGDALYRKVEKEIDWREEVSNFVDDKYSYITIYENGAADALLAASSNINFLELCRVALRANGELD